MPNIGKGFHVLLADDDPVSLEIETIILQSEGCSVEPVTTGLQAVEQALRHRFDVILLDWQMPDLDGVTAAEEINRGGGTAPVILLTGGMAVLPPFPEASHIQGMLTKPLEAEDWRACLNEIFG